MSNRIFVVALVATTMTCASPSWSQDVKITPEMDSVEYDFNGESHRIERHQFTDGHTSESYVRASRACPPFCVQPIEVYPGVNTVGELELLSFLTDMVNEGNGFLIDSRTADFYTAGTIPGSVNLPHNLLISSEENVFFDSVMCMLKGSKLKSGEWTFDDPIDLLLFCNGPWCEQSPSAIKNLIAINYPPEKLHYYRGGMQNWTGLGFTVEIPSL